MCAEGEVADASFPPPGKMEEWDCSKGVGINRKVVVCRTIRNSAPVLPPPPPPPVPRIITPGQRASVASVLILLLGKKK